MSLKRIFNISVIFFTLTLIFLICRIPKAQAQAPFTIVTFTDITGTGANVQLASSGTCKWIQFIAPTANTNNTRVGDINISTTRGAYMAPGSGFAFLPSPSGAGVYSLSTVYTLVQAGDKLSVTCGN